MRIALKRGLSIGASDSHRVAVIGIGNVFLGDDGFGPLVVEMFRCTYACGSNVEVLDLGTPGLDLAPYLYDMDLIVIADAIDAEGVPGTLHTYCEDNFLSGRSHLRLTGHDLGLWESLAQLRLIDRAPNELVLLGVVPESCFGASISQAVLSSSPAAVDTIASLLMERGIVCQPRSALTQPNLWWLPETAEFSLHLTAITRQP